MLLTVLKRKLLWSRKLPFKIEDCHKCTTEKLQLATQLTTSDQISMTEHTKKRDTWNVKSLTSLMNFAWADLASRGSEIKCWERRPFNISLPSNTRQKCLTDHNCSKIFKAFYMDNETPLLDWITDKCFPFTWSVKWCSWSA